MLKSTFYNFSLNNNLPMFFRILTLIKIFNFYGFNEIKIYTLTYNKTYSMLLEKIKLVFSNYSKTLGD